MTDDPAADSPALHGANIFLPSRKVRALLSALARAPLLELANHSMTGSWFKLAPRLYNQALQNKKPHTSPSPS